MSKKRNKQYKQKPVINPLETIAKFSSEPIEDESFADLQRVFLGSLDGMTSDYADEFMWTQLVMALDVSLLLCQGGFKPEMLRTVDAALDAMVIVKQLANNGHGWKLGRHYDVVRAGFVVHQDHMKLPKRILKNTIHEVIRRVEVMKVEE